MSTSDNQGQNFASSSIEETAWHLDKEAVSVELEWSLNLEPKASEVDDLYTSPGQSALPTDPHLNRMKGNKFCL